MSFGSFSINTPLDWQTPQTAGTGNVPILPEHGTAAGSMPPPHSEGFQYAWTQAQTFGDAGPSTEPSVPSVSWGSYTYPISDSILEGDSTAPVSYVDKICKDLKSRGVTLGQFLVDLFAPKLDEGTSHERMLLAFLSGSSKIRAGHVVESMYNHQYSRPKKTHKQHGLYFSLDLTPTEIAYCRPALDTWALHRTLSKLSSESKDLCDGKEHAWLRVRASHRDSGTTDKPENVLPPTSSVPSMTPDPQPVEPESPQKAKRGRPRGSTSKDPQASWDIIDSFSSDKLADYYKENAPVCTAVLRAIGGDSEHDDGEGEVYRPSRIVQTSAFSELLYGRNQSVNLWPFVESITLFASKAHQSTYRIGSRRGHCTPYTTTVNALAMMGERTTGAVAATYGNLTSQDTTAIDIVMDNVQQRQQRHDIRIGTRDEMVTGSAGTGTVLQGLQPGDLSLAKILESTNAAASKRMALDAEKVYDEFLDEGHDMAVKVVHFIDTLVSFIPQLSDMSGDVEALHKQLEKHQIDPKRLTEVHPLGTNGANEVSTQGLNEASTDFAAQIGLTSEDKLGDRAVFWHGDGKTYNGWLTLKRNLSGLKNMLVSFRYGVPVLAPWHLKWTGLGRIINCFWGDREYGKTDPSTLAGMARALNIPPPSDWAHPHFYKYAHLVEVVATGHMLHCWETHFDCKDLEAYFKSIVETRGKVGLPSFTELVEIAKLLVKRYASTRAFEQAVGPHPMEDIVSDSGDHRMSESAPIGEKWDIPAIPCAEEKPREYEHGDADWVLGNSILLLRDAIEFLETCTATARGDPERAWETYKRWIFSFAGGEHHNYATYLLEMLCLIELELPARTRMVLMDNWLVNLKGKPGHFQERDLMQEHFNFWLEELSQHKGKQFDDKWFRRTIAPHVHRFLRIKDQMEDSVALKPRRKEHTEPPKTNEIREVIRLCRQADLHRRHDGRLCGSKAEDHFTKGYKKLAFEGKLSKYIDKSLAVWRSENVERDMPEGVRDLSVYLHEPIHQDTETGRLVI